jgi:hypothetical protein
MTVHMSEIVEDVTATDAAGVESLNAKRATA